jgi:hypothetical protein
MLPLLLAAGTGLTLAACAPAADAGEDTAVETTGTVDFYRAACGPLLQLRGGLHDYLDAEHDLVGADPGDRRDALRDTVSGLAGVRVNIPRDASTAPARDRVTSLVADETAELARAGSAVGEGDPDTESRTMGVTTAAVSARAAGLIRDLSVLATPGSPQELDRITSLPECSGLSGS